MQLTLQRNDLNKYLESNDIIDFGHPTYCRIDMLLAKRLKSNKGQAKAKNVSKYAKRKERRTLLKNVAAVVLLVVLIVVGYQFGQLNLDDIYHPAVIAGAAAFTVYYLLCTIGCFTKEDVIILEDDDGIGSDWHTKRTITNLYRIGQKSSSLAQKFYYMVCLLFSTSFLAFLLYNNFMR